MAESEPLIELPLFPLPDAVVFPGTHLPLHVFEPRYRQLTEDVLAGAGLIGTVLLRASGQSDAQPPAGRPDPAAPVQASQPPICSVGCAGAVQKSQRLSDGRFLIELEGRFRYRIVHELPSEKLYRIALVQPLSEGPAQAGASEQARPPLVSALSELEDRVLELLRLSAPRSEAVLRKRLPGLAGVDLVNALCAGIDCDPGEKQELLEAPTPLERCRRLCAVLQFRIAELQFPFSTRVVH